LFSRTVVEHVLLTMLLAVLAPLVMAQSPTAGSDANALSNSAEIIFRGTVTRIERAHTPNGETAIVLVTFRVDQSVRGCIADETIVVREWAGLWVKNDRYRVGQQSLLQLYPESNLGLTSTVAREVEVPLIAPPEEPSKPIVRLTQSSPSSQSGPRPTLGESHSTRARLRSLPTKLRNLQSEDSE
jgi:hypothetical protein